MKDKIVYILLAVWGVWGATACEDKDFEQIISATDDYTSAIMKEEVLTSVFMTKRVFSPAW